MKGRRYAALSAWAICSVTFVVLATPGAAVAATVRHVSTTGADTGDCSVKPCRTVGYAITRSVAGDTISIAAGTYMERVTIDRSLTLKGRGSDATFIDGSSGGTVVAIGAQAASLAVWISRLTVRNGSAKYGGGISSVPGSGQTNAVTVANAVVSGNHAVGGSAAPDRDAFGGGIYNGSGSTLSIQTSTISSNVATGAPGGYAFSGTAGGSAYGGGIYNAGTLNVSASQISIDAAEGGRGGNPGCVPPYGFGGSGGRAVGGGTDSVGALFVDQSTLSWNSATGAAGGTGACVPPITRGGRGGDGSGGGIAGQGQVANSTIAGNVATGGAGGPGSTHGQNGAALGGGIQTVGAVTLLNATIAENQAMGERGAGGGIDLADGSARPTNSIISGDSAVAGPDCDGTVTSGGHNLVGSDTSCAGFTSPGDLVNVDPRLGPLQDNGGPTQTMALLDGSPAIDAADDAVCELAPVDGVDQRRVGRTQGAHCDSGAYEKR